MKKHTTYWISFLASFALCLGVAMHYTHRDKIIRKFEVPDFSKVFISSYGDKDAVHRIYYFGLFGFDRRIAEADMLIMGNSHAELGLSAGQISAALSTPEKPYKAMNLAMGWGEGFPFAKALLKHQRLQNKSIILEIYATLVRSFSVVGKPVLSEDRFTAWIRSIETSACAMKDWFLDGKLPRITFSKGDFVVGRFLAYPVGLRQLETGDVYDYWIPGWGAVYRNTPEKLISYAKPPEFRPLTDDYLAQSENVLDAEMLKANQLDVWATLLPSNELYQADAEIYTKALHLPFLPIAFDDVKIYDSYHANAEGRHTATRHLLDQFIARKNPAQKDRP